MRWFKSILPLKVDDPIPPEGMNTDQEKQWRIALFTDDEFKAFEWFRQGYTARAADYETILSNIKFKVQ